MNRVKDQAGLPQSESGLLGEELVQRGYSRALKILISYKPRERCTKRTNHACTDSNLHYSPSQQRIRRLNEMNKPSSHKGQHN